jgi:hypothetical protein
VVGGEVGLTFYSVDNQRVAVFPFGNFQFDMGGECRPAKPNDACVLYALQYLLSRGRFVVNGFSFHYFLSG